MNMATKKDIVEQYLKEYLNAPLERKSEILDAITEVTKLHRKSVIRRFKRLQMRRHGSTERRGRPIYFTKDADAALKQFGTEVLKNEKVFQEFLDGADKFDEAFGEALEATGEESVEADKAKDLTKEFEALSSVDKKAQEAIKFAKQLQPKFKKIADKFK